MNGNKYKTRGDHFMRLLKPPKLNLGDKVATVSLGWGGAGDTGIKWRYKQGKKQLEEEFGLEVVEMPHTLAGSEFVYQNPEKRAEDLMSAFSDPTIKAIFCCIGGNESIRMLPYIDLNVIKENPKLFVGYSDNTVAHFICLKAGLSSMYGPSILVDFAETGGIPSYTKNSVVQTLFASDPIGDVPVSPTWTNDLFDWRDESTKKKKRSFQPNRPYEFIQGDQAVQGRLIGGCFEVIETLKGTSLFPDLSAFQGAILFLETSEVQAPSWYLEDGLRNYGTTGVLNELSGIVFAKPQHDVFYEEYKAIIVKVLAEFQLQHLPVLYNASFGHNEPQCIIPIGVMASLDPIKGTFSLLEAAVN